MNRVLSGNPALLAPDPDAAVSEVLTASDRGFLPPQTIAVDDIEEQAVARVRRWNHVEESLYFRLREVGDLTIC